MSELKPTVLKIGGSVITDKSVELAAKTGEIDRLAQEIKSADVKDLIIVHGGGSFGHPSAERYAIKGGYKDEAQKIGFSETHHYMTVLNGLFTDSLVWHKIPCVSIMPSSCIITENGRVKHFEDNPLKNLLNMHFFPVLYGDAVFDTKLGFTILSGDQLVSALAIHFEARGIIIGVDVDGICDSDPKQEKNAKMFEHLTLAQLRGLQNKLARALDKTTPCDVTGGMFGKMSELIPAIEAEIPVTIVNATQPRNILKALKREVVRGTRIEKE